MRNHSPLLKELKFLNGANRLIAGFAISLLLAGNASALDVIDPTGWNYMAVTDSGHYDDSYTAANLFNYDVTGVTPGKVLDQDNAEFARQGGGSSFVAFQLDQVYTNVGSIFYAQRNGFYTDQDKISQISLWASQTTPFDASDPGTPPDVVVVVTNTAGAVWTEYLLSQVVQGQFFLLKLDQATSSGNPGGRELRLGANLGNAPTLLQQSGDKLMYAGGTARFSVQAAGTAPLAYQWSRGGVALSNGDHISGADTAAISITGITLADAGSYVCTVTNRFGSINSVAASLTLAVLPTNPEALGVLSNSPVAFWQLDETPGTTSAADLVGGDNGTYATWSLLGVDGPQPPAFTGFRAGNTAVETYAFTPGSAVALPPLNLSGSNGVTITAWIYPDNSAGVQSPYSGIVFSRGNGTIAGLICSSDGTQLGYQWGGNGYTFPSGLVLPANEWCMVALVVTSNNATLYCSSNNSVLWAIDNSPQPVQTFAGTSYIGLDTDLGEYSRTFNGMVDDVAIFDHALSEVQIDSLFAAGRGSLELIPVQITSQPLADQSLFLTDPLSLSVVATGTTLHYQWFHNDAPIEGATNSTYVVSGVNVSDSGRYFAVISNQIDSVTSSIANVNVSDFLVQPLSPDGKLYSNISDDNHFNDSYTAANLFDFDMTGIAVGTFISQDATEFARNGGGSAFVAFQVDQVYTNIVAIYYAERSGSVDGISQISIWTSQTTPFTAADPGTSPDTIIPITTLAGAVWEKYVLTNVLSGEYFLAKFEQANFGGNPGGREFRLGVTVPPSSTVTLTATSAGLVLTWQGGTLLQADAVTGPWVPATGIQSGVPFPVSGSARFYRIQY